MIIEIIKSAIIGIVQGITEWLPVSSTGHIIIFDSFLKLNVDKAFMEMFEVIIQLGSILAVIVLYFHKLNPFSPKKNKIEKKDTFSLWGKVIVAVIPAAVIGLLFDDILNELFYNPITVSITLIVYGIIFIIIENRRKEPKINMLNDLSYKNSFLIGVFQVLSLIPGTSRSGSTIIGASLLGSSRPVAAEFSFFLAIPVMFGASGLKGVKFLIERGGLSFAPTEWAVLITGLAVSFIVSLFAIKFLMNFIKKHDFKPFGVYRIALGIIVLILGLCKVI